jgi:hypothetical protein
MTRLAAFVVFFVFVGCSQQPPTATSESKDPAPVTATAEVSTVEDAAKAETPQSKETSEAEKPQPELKQDLKSETKPETSPQSKPAATPLQDESPSLFTTTELPKGPMPVYVTPFYNSEGTQINVGDYSQELTEATADSIGPLAAKMKKDWPILSPETMYVTSIRLYDLGQKDDAVYWYYCAQFRARLFQSLLVKESLGRIGAEGQERTKSHGAFHNLAGKYINGYAFGDMEKLKATIKRVKDDNQESPQLKTIYPRLVFLEEKEWPVHCQAIAAGLDEFVVYINDNADMIKANRKAKDTDSKY